jgi:hypothetical protein
MIELSPDYRIRVLDELQWLLERRTVTGGGRWKGQDRRLNDDGARNERWLPYAYCRTKIGLETALSRLRSEGVQLDARLITHLPNFFMLAAVAEPELEEAAE